MTEEQKVEQFTQSVYLARYNRYIDDIQDEDGQLEMDKTIDWTNQLIDELEREADWQYVRENDKSIGTIASPTQTFSLPTDARKLVVDENRPLVIMQDGAIVSVWDVVDPDQITSRNNYAMRDKKVTTVNNEIIFSRPLTEEEVGGEVLADVINDIPRLSKTDASVLELVKPKALLILGVSKNATLPDIVQGGLSPSFAQKYADLLEKAVMENDASSAADSVVRDNYGFIGGIY